MLLVRCFRHRVLLSRQGHSRFVVNDRPDGADEHARDLLPCQKDYRRREDFPERQPPLGQASLHGRRPDFPSEFQRPVGPDEVVVAAQQLKVSFQTLPASRVAERATTKIR